MVETRRQKALRLAENAADDTPNAVTGEPEAQTQPQETVNTSHSAPPTTGQSMYFRFRERNAEERWTEPERFDHTTYLSLTERFDLLEQAIGQWRSQALPLSWRWEEIPRSDQRWLLRWAPNAQYYLGPQAPPEHVSAFIDAWIWRIIWEELFAPDAPNAKWKGKAWKAIADIEQGLGKAVEGQPYESQLQVHYRHTRFGLGRLAYMQHGDHADGKRLRRRILRPFQRRLLDPLTTFSGVGYAEDALAAVVGLAIWVDFGKHFSAHPVEITWSDPLSGRERGFQAREYHGQERAMTGEFLHFDHEHFDIWGFDVDLIRQPFIRVFGIPKASIPGAPKAVQMQSASRLERFKSRATRVFVDCPRQALADAEGVEQNGEDDGGGSGDAS